MQPVIITGASTGLGRALALALARRKGRLCIVARSEDKLADTRARCLELGADACHAIPADLSDARAASFVIDEALERFGTLGALVNNAAIARFSPVEARKADDWEQMLRTNLLAPIQLIACAAPALRRSRGCIVNIGSIGGVLSLPGRAAYGASKAALAHLTRSLARELAPHIRVNAVLPGAIDTEMYTSLGLGTDALAALREEMVRTTPLGRMGTVDDVVPWIELLLSGAGRWVTGSLIIVDGGRSC